MILRKALITLMAVSFFSCSTKYLLTNAEAKQYVEENLTETMQDIEQKHNLKHREEPSISIRAATEKGILQKGGTLNSKYYPENDSIAIYTNNILAKNTSLDAEIMFYDDDVKEMYARTNIDGVLREMLFKYHLDKTSEDLGKGSFPVPGPEINYENSWALRMFEAGTSMYFGLDGKKDPLDYEDYRISVDRLYSYVNKSLYLIPLEAQTLAEEIGYGFVHGILDEQENKWKIVTEMINNPPDKTAIKYPVGYYKTIFEALD